MALPEVADRYDTPLYVVDLDAVEDRSKFFRQTFLARYPGELAPCYPIRCNDSAGVVKAVADAGRFVEAERKLNEADRYTDVEGRLVDLYLAWAEAKAARKRVRKPGWR